MGNFFLLGASAFSLYFYLFCGVCGVWCASVRACSHICVAVYVVARSECWVSFHTLYTEARSPLEPRTH